MQLLEETIKNIKPLDRDAVNKAKARLDRLTMPHWALGRLMDLALELAGMTASIKPPVRRKTVVVMAGDHGVVKEGVSAYPQEVTVQMVANFVAGGAGINALAKTAGAQVKIVDMGVAGDLSELADKGLIISKKVAPGTANMLAGPAMTRDQAVKAVEAGIETARAFADETDVFGTGDMGIGNTTPSSAIIAAFTGRRAKDVTGRGTGLNDSQFDHKVSVVEKILGVNNPDPSNALDVLAKVGGFEIGGIAGLILGAAVMRKPVVIDGLISTAGALIAHALEPTAADYMIAAHKSVEQGHIIALERLGKRPLLDLGMRLGEGTGAALAMTLIDAAYGLLTEVATFEEASVSGSER
jgi:nicotinate-nucleotide--dimethylbenzimidazole phosphoribosyltransferase